VTIVLTDSVDPVEPSQCFDYNVRVTNTSATAAANDLIVKLYLDTDATFSSATNGGTHSAGTVTWTDVDVPANTSVTRTAHVCTSSSADDGEQLRSVAWTNGVTDDETTRVEDDNGDDDSCDVSLVITDDQDPVDIQDEVTYSIRIVNNSSSDETMDVRAFLDRDTVFLDASEDGEEDGDDEVVWEDVDVDGDDSTTLRLDVRVRSTAQAGDRVRLQVRACDEEDTEYTTVEDDFDPVCTGTYCPPVDPVNPGTGVVTVDKQADRAEVQPGSTLSYTLTIRNLSNGAAQGINVDDQFTAGTLTVEDPAGGVATGNGVRWLIPTLGPNETRVIRYRVRVSPAMRHGQIITNTVEVRGAGFDRTATDSAQVSVIQNLPQTGEVSFAQAIDRSNGNLRFLSGSAGSQSTTFVLWTTIITMGMTMGSVLGKRVLF